MNGSDWFIILIAITAWLVRRFEMGELFDIPGQTRPAPPAQRMDDL